jgi:tetratricopeptide (TPR) repeat protein
MTRQPDCIWRFAFWRRWWKSRAMTSERTTQAVTPDAIAAALRQRRHADAVTLLEAWTATHPDDADAWFNLGWARRQILQPDAAIAAYQRALALNIAEPEQVHLNIAAIQADVLFDVAAARTSLQAALAAQPGFVLAWQNLGQLEEDSGNSPAASAAYAEAARLVPTNGRATARLAVIDIFEGRPADALARVERAGARASTADDLVELSFAAANALEALGRYDAAFDQATDANQLQKHSSKVRHVQAEVTRQIDDLIRLFPDVGQLAAAATGLRPVFICGLFRSGSTLLESQLNRRLGLAMGGELAFTPWFMTAEGQTISTATADAAAARFAEGYAAFVRRILPGASLFTDKRMDNFLFIGLLKRAFPEALIINTLRNPIDNFLSMYFLPFADTLSYANDFDDMLHYYRQYRRLMAHWQQLYGDDILTVRYEALVADPGAALAPVAARLGLALADTVSAPEQIIRTASVWQVRQAVHDRSVGRWRHYADHVGELAAALAAEYPEFAGL